MFRANRDNKQLVNHLKKKGYLQTPRIIDAFRVVDRKDFVGAQNRKRAYLDHPLPIEEGQTISQPLTVAFMLERLSPRPGDKILDIGSGSGWTTALLSFCTGIPLKKGVEVGGEYKEVKEEASGLVVGVELEEKLCNFGCQNTSKYFKAINGCDDNPVGACRGAPAAGAPREASFGSVIFLCGDGSKGLPALAPFDRILVSATAPEVPQAWKKQLAPGGTLVFPMGGSLWEYKKRKFGTFKKEQYPGFRFVPLRKETNNTNSTN